MSALRSLVGTFGANVVILFAGIATGVLAARLLLPEGRGELAAIIFWPQLVAALGLFSLSEAVTQRVSAEKLDEAQAATGGLLLGLLLAMVAGAIGVGLMPLLLGPERAALVPTTQLYLVFFLPLNFISLTLLAVDQGCHRFQRFNLLRMIPSLAYLVGLLSLWLGESVTVQHVVWANLAGTVITALLRLWLSRRLITWRLQPGRLWDLFSTGLRFHGATVLITLSTQVDQLMVISLLDNVDVGYYAVALTLAATGLATVANTVHMVMFPLVAGGSTAAQQARLITLGMGGTTLVVVLLAVSLAVLAPWLVPLLFGDEFLPAVLPAQVLVVAYVPVALRHVAIRILRGIGAARPGFVGEAIGLLLFVLLGWLLVPRFGILGVAIALLISAMTAYAYLLQYMASRFGIRMRRLLGFDVAVIHEVFSRTVALVKLTTTRRGGQEVHE